MSNPRITAYIDNPCFECDRSYATPATLLKHFREKHDILLEPRQSSVNRPASVKYKFVSSEKPHRRTLYGCPSCWFHCHQDYARLKKHIYEIHLDDTNEMNKEDPDDDDEDESDEEDEYHQDVVSARSELEYLVKDIKGGMDSLISLFNRLVFVGAAKKGDEDGYSTAEEGESDVENDELVKNGNADYVDKKTAASDAADENKRTRRPSLVVAAT